jgi:hypothetical protein
VRAVVKNRAAQPDYSKVRFKRKGMKNPAIFFEIFYEKTEPWAGRKAEPGASNSNYEIFSNYIKEI